MPREIQDELSLIRDDESPASRLHFARYKIKQIHSGPLMSEPTAFDDFIGLTKEKQEYDRKDPLRGQQLIGRLPFLGSLLNAAHMLDTRKAAQRIEAGEAKDEDYWTVARLLESMEVNEERAKNEGWWDKAKNILAELPTYATEFLATGGAYTGVRKGIQAAGTAALKSAAKTSTQKLAGRLVTGIASRAAGVAAQTLANPQMIAENTSRRALNAQFSGDDSDLLANLPAGFADSFIELGTERAGGMLGKAAGGAAGKLTNNALLRPLRDKLVSAWSKLHPSIPATRIAERLGWNGIIGEIGEERVGDIARGVLGELGVSQMDWGVVGDIAEGNPAVLEQLQAEGAAFSLAGAGSIGLHQAINLMQSASRSNWERHLPGHRLNSEARQDGVENLTLQFKERIADIQSQQSPEETPPVLPQAAVAPTIIPESQAREDLQSVPGDSVPAWFRAAESQAEVVTPDSPAWFRSAESQAESVQQPPPAMPAARPTQPTPAAESQVTQPAKPEQKRLDSSRAAQFSQVLETMSDVLIKEKIDFLQSASGVYDDHVIEIASSVLQSRRGQAAQETEQAQPTPNPAPAG